MRPRPRATGATVSHGEQALVDSALARLRLPSADPTYKDPTPERSAPRRDPAHGGWDPAQPNGAHSPHYSPLPATVTHATEVFGDFDGDDKWHGYRGVAAHGKFYLPPDEARGVLVVDAALNSTAVGLVGDFDGKEGWCGGVVTSNGKKVYFAPYNAQAR